MSFNRVKGWFCFKFSKGRLFSLPLLIKPRIRNHFGLLNEFGSGYIGKPLGYELLSEI